jgi:hypothetical protein
MRAAAALLVASFGTLSSGCGSSGSSDAAGDGGYDASGESTNPADAAYAPDGTTSGDAAARDAGFDHGGSADAAHAEDATVDASGTDAAESDATGSAPDVSPPAFEAGAPITAPANQWTWVPFANALCANGSATGIGVNLSTASSRVLIYLEGGGACWSELTCETLQTAANFTSGYSQSNFMSESTDTTYLAASGGFFDRTASSNPFKDDSFVYVPYCTGDAHAGDNIVNYGGTTAYHVGFRNVAAYLARLVPTFPSADRVFLAGSSTGGLGAVFNWWQVQNAFGSVRVDLIDDSGTFMPPDVLDAGASNNEPAQRAEWNLAATLPPGCTACATRLDALYPFYASAFPHQRAALLSYTQDSVLPSYYGISTAQFTAGLDEELSTAFAPNPNLQAFIVGSSGHVLFFDPTVTQGSTTLTQFLTLMVTDDPSWATVQP